MQTLSSLLELMNEKNASDLHLTIGSPPRFRISGKLLPIDQGKLTLEQITKYLKEYLNDKQLEQVKHGKELDFTIGIPGLSRYRVNVFKQRGNPVASFRRLPFDVPKIDSLGLTDAVIELTNRRKGLILVTGATGSGKSTTLAAMAHKISNELEGHIITIEDPIEYLYPHSKALINQREVGIDSETFSSALKSALRQDPDVVIIGELRDPESMQTALTIAETGHLVLATLHSNDAAGTITRIIDVFPPEKQEVIRMNLSMSLIGIISQQLIPNVNDNISLALEILINTPSIKNLIRDNNIHQINNYILSGTKDGMIRMDDSILKLYNENLISKDSAITYAHNPSELTKKLSNF